MTDEEIDVMEAGWDLDVLIAEQVMGDKPPGSYPLRCNAEWYTEGPRSYSSDIAAAWLVVEKMIPDYYLSLYFGEDGFYCHFDDFGTGKHHGEAPTAPLAICRAALKCCKAVADKKEDAVEAPSPDSLRLWWDLH